MKFIRGLANQYQLQCSCVATIGSFDALHLGHQALLKVLQAKSHELDLPTTVVIFEPQPREFFQPDTAPVRVLRLRDKIALLAQMGIDQVWCLRFNADLAALTAQQFIEHVLVDALQVKHLMVGDDFRFGAKRQGDYQTLVAAGKQHGFSVTDTPSVTIDNRRVSSTWVREALQAGDFALVQQLIDRPYQLTGKVHRGDQRGRLLGFPTLNIRLEHPMAVNGVYVVQVDGLDQPYHGVANVGVRPTVDGTRRLLEVHLFHFGQEVYGANITVTFRKQLRSEQKFADIGALTEQIRRDVAAAQHYIAS